MGGPSFGQKLALGVGGALLALLTLEVGLRSGGYLYRAALEKSSRDALANRADVRILCLGESTTAFGGKHSYPSQLERILNGKTTAVTFSVINGGVPATATDRILANLEANLDRFQPHVVVTMMGVNDARLSRRAATRPLDRAIDLISSLRVYKLYALLMEHLGHRVAEIRGSEDPGPPESPSSHPMTSPALSMASGLLSEGRKDEARDILEKEIERNPGNVFAHALLVETSEGPKRGPRKKLIAATRAGLRERIAVEPANFDLQAAMARLHVLDRDARSALALFGSRTPADLTSDIQRRAFAEAHALSARQAAKDLRWDDAAAHLRAAVEALPAGDDVPRATLLSRLGRAEEHRGDAESAQALSRQAGLLLSSADVTPTVRNYRALKEILDARGIRLVAVQYPLRSLDDLRAVLGQPDDVVFVDNHPMFTAAVRLKGYFSVFTDEFAGDFGHLTREGNRLLATNVANAVLQDLYGSTLTTTRPDAKRWMAELRRVRRAAARSQATGAE